MSNLAKCPRCGFDAVSGASKCIRCVSLARLEALRGPRVFDASVVSDLTVASNCGQCGAANGMGHEDCLVCQALRSTASSRREADSAPQRSRNLSPKRSKSASLFSEALGFLSAWGIALVISISLLGGCFEMLDAPEPEDTRLERRWARFGY